MTGTQTVRRTTTRARRGGSMQRLRGRGAAMLTTIIVVAVFALLMQWVKPTEDTVRIFNQLLKVVSVAIGTYIAVRRGQEGGLLRGSLIGLLYMALGVAAYALLSGQDAPWTAYLADLAMGTATGGIIGAIVSNISGK